MVGRFTTSRLPCTGSPSSLSVSSPRGGAFWPPAIGPSTMKPSTRPFDVRASPHAGEHRTVQCRARRHPDRRQQVQADHAAMALPGEPDLHARREHRERLTLARDARAVHRLEADTGGTAPPRRVQRTGNSHRAPTARHHRPGTAPSRDAGDYRDHRPAAVARRPWRAQCRRPHRAVPPSTPHMPASRWRRRCPCRPG